jgi:hypothetical protein
MVCPTPPPLLRLAPVLRRQHGVVTAAQATAHGVAPRSLGHLRRRGLLVALHRGVYRCALTPDTWEARALAAQLAGGPHVALGRWSAARLLGLTRPGATELDLVVPRGRHVRAGVRPTPRTSTHLTDADVLTIGRFRCGSVAWTLGELAAISPSRTVERIAARAVAEDRTTTEELAALCSRLWATPGVLVLRRVVGDSCLVHPGSRSRAESRLVNLAVRAGLPRPIVNHAVVDASGRRRELDAAWCDHGVAVELDLHPTHATTIGRRSDGARQNDLVHAWVLLRFDAHDLEHRSDEVVRQIRRALQAAGWSPGT